MYQNMISVDFTPMPNTKKPTEDTQNSVFHFSIVSFATLIVWDFF